MPARTSMKKKYSIMIVEDHAVYRMGLKELIRQEDDLAVCGETDNIDDAWQLMKKLNADLVIVDLSLKDSNGLSLIKDINKYDPKLPILVLSMYDESLYAERALSAGAMGYVMKQEASECIIKAIRHVLGGNIYVSEKITASILFRRASRSGASEKSRIEDLTDRELEVFHLIGKGYKTGEIAKKLNLSVRTIGVYRDRIKEKLNLKNSADLAKHAALWIEKNNLSC